MFTIISAVLMIALALCLIALRRADRLNLPTALIMLYISALDLLSYSPEVTVALAAFVNTLIKLAFIAFAIYKIVGAIRAAGNRNRRERVIKMPKRDDDGAAQLSRAV